MSIVIGKPEHDWARPKGPRFMRWFNGGPYLRCARCGIPMPTDFADFVQRVAEGCSGSREVSPCGPPAGKEVSP